MIVLITPTGARLDQFKLCAGFMIRQTYEGGVKWIIVDDASPLTTNIVQDDFRKGWDIIKVYPVPRWRGQNTQARNLRAGLDTMVKNYDLKDVEAIFIIEDDDYYRPEYLSKMMEQKKDFWAWGETRTVYYNVKWRRFLINGNISHSSLFQTAFTPDLLNEFRATMNHKFIDAGFWKVVKNKNLFFNNFLSVGIKGMPGRGGIGAGHSLGMTMSNDIEMRYLRKLIGLQDAQLYERYYSANSQPRHTRFITKSRR